MKIFIDEINPDAIGLHGNKAVFKENFNTLYFAVCCIKDDHLSQLGKNFIKTIETKSLTVKDKQPVDNILNLVPTYHSGIKEHYKEKSEKNDFKCHCGQKESKAYKENLDICGTTYQTCKIEKITELLVNSPLKQKIFLQFLSKNDISIDIFVINCQNFKNITNVNKSQNNQKIPKNIYNQTGIISYILSELAYEKLNNQDGVDIYIDFGSFLQEKSRNVFRQYVKSKLKKGLFSFHDIEKNISKAEDHQLEEISDINPNDIFKLMPVQFGGERNILINFVHQKTDPIILLPDLILKSYKRLYLDSVDEKENLELFNNLTQLNSEKENAKIRVGNMKCDADNTAIDKEKRKCQGYNLIYGKNNNHKKLVGNESESKLRYLCGGHKQNLKTKYKLLDLINEKKGITKTFISEEDKEIAFIFK